MRRFKLFSACLLLLLLVRTGGAAVLSWDPNGTSSVGGNGTWDYTTANWSPSSTELQTSTASLVTWNPATAATNAACFSAGPSSGSSQGTFTITVNSVITNAGIYNGSLNPGSDNLTISGTGSLYVAAGLATLSTAGTVAGTTTINVPITGPGTIQSQGHGGLVLNEANTFSGGFNIDGSGGVSYGNNTAFGTGTITWMIEGYMEDANIATAFTIANPMVHLAATEAFGASTMGTTYSGSWTLPASGTTTLDLTAGNHTVTGAISGGAQLAIEGSGSLYLYGDNTYSGGTALEGAQVVGFNQNNSFGTGTLTLTGTGNALVAGVTTPITIANPVTVTASIHVNFVGNASGVTYGGPWTLGGNLLTFYTGSTSGAIDIISGVISGSAGFTVADAGTLILTGLNTYSGETTLSASLGALPVLVIGGAGDLGDNGSGSGNYPYNIANAGTFIYGSSASQILSGQISGAGPLIETNGILTLSGNNSYTGATTINGGTLALGSGGSINNTTTINIGAGGTFDVSGADPYSLNSAILTASGTANPATINDSAPGGTINLGSQTITLNYDGSHPALTISSGTLMLNNNPITVNGPPLALGTYAIIQQAGGGISSTGPYAVSGTALGGNIGIISVNGGTVNLTITVNPSPSPAFTGASINGTTLTLTATNGTPNEIYVLLQSTNVALPLNQWTPVATNYFDVNGDINLSTNIVIPGNPQEYYGIEAP